MTRVFIRSENRKIAQAIRALKGLETKVARDGVRLGVRKATSYATKELKREMPAGKTRLLKLSIAPKTRFNLSRATAAGWAGQRTDKAKRGGGFTSKQRARAGNKRGRISGGITRRKHAPPIHLVDSPVAQHTIRVKNAKALWWNIGRGGAPIPWKTAQRVMHPGHSGKGITRRVERRTRPRRLRIMRTVIESAVRESVA